VITHDEALQQMEAYFANQLSRDEVRAFHAHMNSCEDCKVRLRTMRAAAPNPGFSRLQSPASQEAKLQEILRRNRVIMYAVLAVMICFFFFFRLKRG
jgi:anti-sigma factor RsiW